MIKKILSSEFNKNVLTLLTGSSLARAMPILVSPLLTRLYSPDAFGVLALFIAVSTILGSLANGRYELAIVLPKKEKEVINVAALSILIAALFSVFLFIIVLFFGEQFLKIENISELSYWIYFIPLVVFLIGLFESLTFLNTKYKNFKVIAQSNVVRSFGMSIIQLVMGFIKSGATGLITGQIFSQIAGNSRLGLRFIKDRELLRSISFQEMKRLGKKYINFPKFSLGSNFLNQLSQNMVNFFIPLLYSLTYLGFYSLVQRILATPLTLISKATTQVYYEKATSNYNNDISNMPLFKSMIKKLSIITLAIFLPLLLLSDWLIPFVFGEKWSEVVTFIFILSPLFIVRFIVVPLSITNSIYEKQKVDLYWQLLFTISSIIIFLLSYWLDFNIYNFFILYTTVSSIVYLVYLLLIYLVIKGKI